MSYNHRDIPYSVKELLSSANEFSFAKFDTHPEVEPKLLIKVWGDVFASGGHVALEIAGTSSRALLRINVHNNHDVREVKEALEQVVDEWNDDSRRHFNELIEHSRTFVLEYTKSQIAEYQKNLVKYEQGDWS